MSPLRLAFVVSHPIQYYVPLYRRLAARSDVEIKVFYTWHAGSEPVFDRGFKQAFKWDIPLTDGYEHQAVPNTAADPGTHHFLGLRNPTLVSSVLAWRPDIVHITGYAGCSHLRAMYGFARRGLPVLFRGDSHLLDVRNDGPREWVKRLLLRQVYAWPSVCLYVGEANRAYYEAFDVPASKLAYCPHSVDVSAFACRHEEWEREARSWRRTLNIGDGTCVLLFAGKFEARKQPCELMRAVAERAPGGVVLVMVGNGELESDVRRYAACYPERFRVLPFQNQTRMPVVYRLADIFVLPSAYGETWGLAVNEALACGRPVIASDKVGCAADVLHGGRCGWIFRAGDWPQFAETAARARDPDVMRNMAAEASSRAWDFDIGVTERTLMDGIAGLMRRRKAVGPRAWNIS